MFNAFNLSFGSILILIYNVFRSARIPLHTKLYIYTTAYPVK